MALLSKKEKDNNDPDNESEYYKLTQWIVRLENRIERLEKQVGELKEWVHNR